MMERIAQQVKTAEAKDSLRSALLRAREDRPVKDAKHADGIIAEAVRTLPEWASARFVLTYLSFGREVDTVALIEDALASGRRVALPRVVGGGQMAWHEIGDLEDLVPSKMGMDEPAPDPDTEIDIATLDADSLALVPGLAFDGHGYRLGYGGGYYDRFLPMLHEAGGCAVGLCRSWAFQEHLLPHESYDVPVDIVVTEKGIMHPGPSGIVESL